MHPYPGQQPPPTGSTLTIHTSYPGIAFGYAMTSPAATINGHPVPLRWGANPIPMQPGIHDVKVHVKYLWDVGHAQLPADTRSGAPVDVYYSAPIIAMMAGAIGHQPVKSPHQGLGIALFVGIPAVILLVFFALCCIGTLSGP